MIEVGVICTLFPGHDVQYEITNVVLKTTKIKVEKKEISVTKKFVDLQEVNDHTNTLKNISEEQIKIVESPEASDA